MFGSTSDCNGHFHVTHPVDVAQKEPKQIPTVLWAGIQLAGVWFCAWEKRPKSMAHDMPSVHLYLSAVTDNALPQGRGPKRPSFSTPTSAPATIPSGTRRCCGYRRSAARRRLAGPHASGRAGWPCRQSEQASAADADADPECSPALGGLVSGGRRPRPSRATEARLMGRSPDPEPGARLERAAVMSDRSSTDPTPSYPATRQDAIDEELVEQQEQERRRRDGCERARL
jgi:hypothetical protein